MREKADAGYRIGEDGRVEFTAEDRAFFTAYFGFAGIDIRRIVTREDLHRASRQAFPVLFDFMTQRLRQRPQTLETRALLAILRNDEDALARVDAQLATRERLSVIEPVAAPRDDVCSPA
jgi:hypothetical protein